MPSLDRKAKCLGASDESLSSHLLWGHGTPCCKAPKVGQILLNRLATERRPGDLLCLLKAYLVLSDEARQFPHPLGIVETVFQLRPAAFAFRHRVACKAAETGGLRLRRRGWGGAPNHRNGDGENKQAASGYAFVTLLNVVGELECPVLADGS